MCILFSKYLFIRILTQRKSFHVTEVPKTKKHKSFLNQNVWPDSEELEIEYCSSLSLDKTIIKKLENKIPEPSENLLRN